MKKLVMMAVLSGMVLGFAQRSLGGPVNRNYGCHRCPSVCPSSPADPRGPRGMIYFPELSAAVLKEDKEKVNELLQQGVNPNEQGNKETINKFLNMGAEPDEIGSNAHSLHLACAKGNIKIVRLLIAAGADINKKMENSKHDIISPISGWGGLRPIHCAKTVEIARILKEAGANIFATRDTID